MSPSEHLFATSMLDARLLRLFQAESDIYKSKPTRMAQAQPIVMKSLEIALNAHKRGGVTGGQLQELEINILKLEELAR